MKTGLVYFSAALGLGLLMLWPWSHFRGYLLGVPWEQNATVGASNGELIYWSADKGEASRREEFDARKEPMTAAWIEGEMGRPFAVRLGSFAWGSFRGGGPVPIIHTVGVVPIWFPAGLAMLPMVWRLVGWRRPRGRGFPVVTVKGLPASTDTPSTG